MMKRSFLPAFSAVILAMLCISAFGQRPRAITDDPNSTPANAPAPPPATVKAKYEGGVFGVRDKKTGTLTLDNRGSRLVFRDGKQTELISLPFAAITGAYADSHSVQPAAATVISHVPLYGIPASLIKTKVRYLTLQFDDPDSKVAGVTSFRLENKEILDSVLYSLATQAGLTKRGDIYVRKKS